VIKSRYYQETDLFGSDVLKYAIYDTTHSPQVPCEVSTLLVESYVYGTFISHVAVTQIQKKSIDPLLSSKKKSPPNTFFFDFFFANL
jgi:hypothetical protein